MKPKKNTFTKVLKTIWILLAVLSIYVFLTKMSSGTPKAIVQNLLNIGLLLWYGWETVKGYETKSYNATVATLVLAAFIGIGAMALQMGTFKMIITKPAAILTLDAVALIVLLSSIAGLISSRIGELSE